MAAEVSRLLDTGCRPPLKSPLWAAGNEARMTAVSPGQQGATHDKTVSLSGFESAQNWTEETFTELIP